MRALIFIVDDQRQVAEASALLMRGWGHTVTVETDAHRALQILLSDAQFDVTFLDILMPDLTGGQIYNELKTKAPARLRRIIFLTGMAYMVEEWLRQTGLPVIEKGSVDIDKLARTIQQYAQLDCTRGPRELGEVVKPMTKERDLRDLLLREADDEDSDDDADDTGVFITKLEQNPRGTDLTFALGEYLHKKNAKLAKRVGLIEKKIDRAIAYMAGFAACITVLLGIWEVYQKVSSDAREAERDRQFNRVITLAAAPNPPK